MLTGLFGFVYFAMLNTLVPGLIFLGIILSFVPHDLMYGPQAALIAECFTPAAALQRLLDRLSARLGHRRRPGAADRHGAARRATGSGYAIAGYIAVCAIVSIIATLMMPDHTNKDISEENA